MTTTTEVLERRLQVAKAIDAFIEMANSHPTTLATYGGYTYTAQASGKKYRIVMTPNTGNGASVHAFVDAETGDLLKAASWKVPAKGVRYNLLTEMDVVEANFDWSGRYLYHDYRRKPVPAPVVNTVQHGGGWAIVAPVLDDEYQACPYGCGRQGYDCSH